MLRWLREKREWEMNENCTCTQKYSTQQRVRTYCWGIAKILFTHLISLSLKRGGVVSKCVCIQILLFMIMVTKYFALKHFVIQLETAVADDECLFPFAMLKCIDTFSTLSFPIELTMLRIFIHVRWNDSTDFPSSLVLLIALFSVLFHLNSSGMI